MIPRRLRAARLAGLLFVAIALAGASPVWAGGYFGLSATTSGGQSVSVQGSNLINLTNNLLKTQSSFAALSGQAYSASLTYGGVSNAVKFDSSADGKTVTLSIPITGFSRTFTGTSQSDVEHQIRKFLETDGASAYSKLLRRINQLSLVATNDGNPQAAIEFFASEAYEQFGLNPTLGVDLSARSNGAQFSVRSSGGSFTSDDGNGTFATVDPSFGWRFGDNVGLVLAVPIEYRNTQDASTYIGGTELGLPVTLINDRGGDGFSWQITPWGIGGVAASADLVAGGVFAGGGGTNNLNLQIGPLTFTMANQLAYEKGIPVSWSQYTFDTNAEQLVLTNGGQVKWSPARAVSVYGGASYTNLLRKAALPNYLSPTAGVDFNFNTDSGVRVAYQGDFCHGYRNNGGEVDLFLSY
jgi:hypothetical protein